MISQPMFLLSHYCSILFDSTLSLDFFVCSDRLKFMTIFGIIIQKVFWGSHCFHAEIGPRLLCNNNKKDPLK